jgi:hypothetical protein
MLSDKGSVVIREFGILNTNVPPDVTRFYGIPFPGQYLIAPDDTVKNKLFLADYQERPTASEVLLKDFGVGGNSVTVQTAGVSAKVTVSDAKSYSGHRLGVTVAFEVAPGWHIYGTPLPAEYTRTQVKFGDDLIQSESLTFPPSTPVKFEALGQTLPVYSGSFKAVGDILLKTTANARGLQAGRYNQIPGVQRYRMQDSAVGALCAAAQNRTDVAAAPNT